VLCAGGGAGFDGLNQFFVAEGISNDSEFVKLGYRLVVERERVNVDVARE
jgi:hypothetical protein